MSDEQDIKIDGYTRHFERAGAFQELMNLVDGQPHIDKLSLKSILKNLIGLNMSRHERELQLRRDRAKAAKAAKEAQEKFEKAHPDEVSE